MSDTPTPKPRQEVLEETRETLELLDLDRQPRPLKMAREQALLGDADEVSYQERAFRSRHPKSLDEIRAAVDAMPARREATPQPLPPAPEPAALPVPTDQRAALAGVMPGALVSVETVYHVARGEVVEAVFEHEGARAKGLFLLRDGQARPVDDIESRIDALPTPAPRAAAASPQQPSSPPPSPQEEKKSAFSRFGRKPKEDAPAPPPAPADEAPKRKFGFGRKKS